MNVSSVMVIWKCLAMWRRPSTAPTAWPIAAAPRSGLRARCTRAAMRARSFSVPANSSVRLRARSSVCSMRERTVSTSRALGAENPDRGPALGVPRRRRGPPSIPPRPANSIGRAPPSSRRFLVRLRGTTNGQQKLGRHGSDFLEDSAGVVS